MQESLFGSPKSPSNQSGDIPGLQAVFARFVRSVPFSWDLFDGFKGLRVLTYSASIPAIVKTLDLFEEVECVFGYEGILTNLQSVLACQKMLADNVLMAVKNLPDQQQQRLVEALAAGQAHLRIVKDQIAHAKIFLLESPGRRRVLVGSANLSLRAFSGRQEETLLAFDNDPDAWAHFDEQYRFVRDASSIDFTLPPLSTTEVRVEDLPLLQQASDGEAVTVFVGADPTEDGGRANIRVVEQITTRIAPVVQNLTRPQKGWIELTPKVVGKIIRTIRNRHADVEVAEPTRLTINRDSRRVLLSGNVLSLDPEPDDVATDVECLLEYFSNFDQGFRGNVKTHKRNYFTFMAWFYGSPFICELRNYALREGGFIFDYPQFAILYGRSNCGKTLLAQTLMHSMFGRWEFIEKTNFTQNRLRGLLHASGRFPIVFDDVDRNRFRSHAPDVIKDETLILAEYPPVVLSMNAETQAFRSEISKRCLMLYTNASVPDEPELTRVLSKSTHAIHDRLGNALYRSFLDRLLCRLDAEDWDDLDLLHLSSSVLHDLFAKHAGLANLPDWCAPIRMDDYQGRKHEKVRTELLKLYDTHRKIWNIRREEVILAINDVHEARALMKEIPDHVLGEGSKAGHLVLRRSELEQFLDRRLGTRWTRLLRR